MIDASKFASPHVSGKSVFRFSLDSKESIANSLRDFAEKIEKGEFLVQKVQTGQTANLDEYSMQALYIEFAVVEYTKQDRPVPERIVELP